MPFSQSLLSLFVAYLCQQSYASSTVQSYISAIGYLHKLAGFADPTKSFLLSQILKGYGKVSARQDSRLPITPTILNRLIHISNSFKISPHQRAIFQAMCSLAFHAFLRVGEITMNTKQGSPPPLQLHQCFRVVDNSNQTVSLRITFLDYKHNYNKPPFTIVIKRQPDPCPVKLMLDYLKFRGTGLGCLFLGMDGYQLSAKIFVTNYIWLFKHVDWILSFIKVIAFV